MRKLNLQKSPESNKDWYVSTILKSATSLPKSVTLKEYCGMIRDQGAAGLCHSFAGAALKNIQEYKEKGYKQNLSPLYLAKEVKSIDGKPNTEGSNLLRVCKAW